MVAPRTISGRHITWQPVSAHIVRMKIPKVIANTSFQVLGFISNPFDFDGFVGHRYALAQLLLP